LRTYSVWVRYIGSPVEKVRVDGSGAIARRSELLAVNRLAPSGALGRRYRARRVVLVTDAVPQAGDQGFREIAGLGTVLCTTAETISWRA